MKQHCTLIVLLALVLFLQATTSPAQVDSPVAATVNDHRITVEQVQWLLQRKFAERQIDEDLKAHLEAEVLEQLVKQLVVLDFLEETSDDHATDDEIRLAIDRIAEEAKRIDKTVKQLLEEQNLSERGFRENLKWQISWKRYTDRLLTNENLEKFFDQNRSRYDGTEIQVAHLLLKPDEQNDLTSTVQQAQDIRERLLAGEVSWHDAVKKYSKAPTADKGGDLGWIRIDGPMPINFTESAFRLEVDDISEVVVTNFGVHLIRCLEIKPGGINWYDADERLKRDAIKFLFDKIVDDQRPRVSIRYSGRIAYVDPESGELVKPKEE